MSNTENDKPSTNTNGKCINTLELGPRKKVYAMVSGKGDPLIHHGRHFCHTIHAMCNIYALLTQSVMRVVEQEGNMRQDEDFTDRCGNFHFLELYQSSS
jgi:hypothetical protein